MASEWQAVSLGDVIDVKHGFAFQGEFIDTEPHGDVLLTPGNFAIGGGFKGDKFKYYEGPVPPEYILNEGDLIVTMTDLSKQADTLGYPAFVPHSQDGRRFLHNQRIGKVIVKDDTDIGYLHYLLCSSEYRHEVLASATGTTVKHTSPTRIMQFKFSRPPIGEQHAIAYILGTLDDKIDLNRRMNATLEAMARALFKSWFVDFDPVRAKAEGRDTGLPKHIADLFPTSLVGSELGEIPGGWNVGRFDRIVEQLRDPENPMASPAITFRHFSIPAFDEGQAARAELGDSIKSIKSRVQPGVILLSKLNPEIERVWLVDVEGDDRAVCSTEFLVLRPRPPFGRAYAYCLARSPAFRLQIEAHVTGTSNSHQRAQAGSVLSLAVTLPTKEVSKAFEGIASPLLARTLACRRESRLLAGLRDTLLSKLISGELRVKDAERIAGAVL